MNDSSHDPAPGTRWRGMPAPSPGPADIGLVVAMAMEVQPYLAGLERVRRYRSEGGDRFRVIEGETSDGRLVAVALAGMGRESARLAALRLLAGHRPRWVVSVGFGGALDPSLARGDLVVAREILGPEIDDRLHVDLKLEEAPARPGRRIRSGRLVTVDRVIRTAAEKAELRSQTGADVVDMETSAVASLCQERNQRFISIRVISDEASLDLPPEILTIIGPSGSFRLGATVGALWRRPSSVKELWALREAAIEASDRLAKVLPELLAPLR